MVAVDARTHELWRKAAEAVYPKIRGPIVPAARSRESGDPGIGSTNFPLDSRLRGNERKGF